MSKLTAIALAAASAPTGSATTTTGVDISDFTGSAKLILDCAQPAAAETLDVKLQHCDTVGGTYTDAGSQFVFPQVTNAGGAVYSVLDVNIDGLKKFVKAVRTKVGSTALPHSVSLVGNKAL